MVTDAERRTAAQSLKHFAYDQLQGGLLNTLKLATGVDGTWRNVLLRLAGLIEPSIPADPGEAGLTCVDAFIREHTEKPVDRDALLKLADEIDRKSNDGTVNPDPMRPLATSLDLFGYARRIREIVGEDGHGPGAR